METTRLLRRKAFTRISAAVLVSLPSVALGVDKTWSGADANWNTPGNWTPLGVPGAADAVFLPNPAPSGGSSLTLTAGQLANALTFHSSYSLSGGDLTLTAGSGGVVNVRLAELASINSQLLGSAGLTINGGGGVFLGNVTNSFTGTTTINNGSLIVANASALGGSTSQIVVNGSPTRGFGGGSLVLYGDYGSGINLSRDVALQGRGPITDRSGALVSLRNNTLSGVVSTGGGLFNTSLTSASGRLTFGGTLDVGGTAGTTLTILGLANNVGVGSYAITGALTGTGTLEKSGAGTLLLNPSDASGFSGRFRVTGGTMRVTSAASLGTANGATTAAPLDMNAGTLEVRMDTPTIGKNMYVRAGSTTINTLFVDRALGGSAINGTATFGTLSYEDGQTVLFGGRNGFGATFAAAPVNGGNGNSNFTNNLNGTLTFTGAFWSNTENTGNRTMTLTGTGNTLLTGNLTASAAAFDHILTKAGTGTVTITSTGSTLDGAVNVNDGTLAITDFRSITNNTAALNLGATTTTGSLAVIGNDLVLANITTAKAFNLAGTTGGGVILANQTGTSPGIVISGGVAAGGAGTKTLTLGGSNTGANVISGAIVNNSAANITMLAKTDPGTWALAGTNTNTGSLLITNGTLKLNAAAAGATVLNDTTAVGFGFNATAQSAGGTLELVGAPSVASNEVVGPLGIVSGAATVVVTPGAGGTGSLTFASIGTTQTTTAASAASTTVTVSSTAGLVPGMVITGTGVTANAVVSAITSGTTFTASAAQTIAATTALTFSRPSGVVINSGGTVNFVPGTGSVIIGSVPAVGLLNAYSYFNGADFAYAPATVSATLRAPVYDTDVGFNTVAPTATLTANNNNFVDASSGTAGTVVEAAPITISTLKMGGGSTLTADGLVTIQAAAGNPGGILLTGGAATIGGTAGITTGGAGDLVIRTNLSTDVLTLATPITSTTTGGLTKTGAGTLVISAVNAQTGVTNINEGTVRLLGTGRLSAANANFNLRQGATLDVNGLTTGTAIGQFNGSGTITNSNAAAGTLQVGNNNGTGTFNGVIQDGLGQVNVTKVGTGGQTWSGLSTYTGTTTIQSTGIVSVLTLADIGSASSIGAGVATNATTNAASLVFAGTSTTQAYGGISYTGRDSISINRLFTINGAANGGARIQNNSANNSALIFSNTGPILFGAAATGNAQGIVLGGSSTSDNTFNPQITNNGATVTNVYKSDAGLWILGNASNTYTGVTQINAGQLRATDGSSLPTGSNLVLNGGVYEANTFARTLGTGAGTFNWVNGGFAAAESKLVINLGSAPTWNSTSNFVLGSMTLSSTTALAEVEIASGFEITQGVAGSPSVTTTNASSAVTTSSTVGLSIGQAISGTGIPAGATIANITGPTTFNLSANATASGTVTATILAGGFRQITVNDNTSTQTDFATVTGVISGNGTLRKAGAGVLQLFGANTYTGQTQVTEGVLVVTSLGRSDAPGLGTSLGLSTDANLSASALLLGNAGTTGTTLQYVGPGETSDRLIQLNTTTGNTQIHADGAAPLVLTNVRNNLVAGAKTLFLRGSNAQANMITNVLTDNSGALGVQIDGGATWVLTGNGTGNTYTGTTTINAGAAGAGHNAAFGIGTISLGNASTFAYGGDRVIGNAITHSDNTTHAFIGDYNLTFTGTYALGAAGNNIGTTNTIVSGKALTFNAVTADAITGTRTWTIGGTGDTTINGSITTSTANSLNITYSGTGTLTLGGTASDWNAGTLAINNGTLRLAANEVIPHGTGSGTVSVGPAVDLTATLDLDGKNETINGLTMTSAGTAIINNPTATALTFTIGSGDGATTVSNPLSQISNTGGGAVSLVKTGTGVATFSAGNHSFTGATSVNGGTLNINTTFTGTSSLLATGTGVMNINAPHSLPAGAGISTAGTATMNVNAAVTLQPSTVISAAGGTMNINTALTLPATTSLSATGGVINVNSPFANPANVTSVTVNGGSALNLTDGAGTALNPTTLSLGAGTGIATLGLQLGSSTATSDRINTTNPATVANTIRFDIFALPGFGTAATYDLLTAPSGLSSATAYQLGVKPAGYNLSFSTLSDTLVQLGVTVDATPTTHYWRGVVNNSWAGFSSPNTNWTTDAAGAANAGVVPGASTTVIFSATTAVGPAISTTLDGSYIVNDLQFTAAPTGVTGVTIATGGGGPTNTLGIAPASSTVGISVAASAGTIQISAPVNVISNQTWDVAATGTNNTLLAVSGPLSGSGNITKTGVGIAVVQANSPAYGGNITLSNGTLSFRSDLGGSGVALPFGAGGGANLTVTGNSGVDVANFTPATTNMGNVVLLGGLNIGAQTLTVTGSTPNAGLAGGNLPSFGLVFNGNSAITGNATFAMGATGGVAPIFLGAPMTLAGQVTSVGNNVTVSSPLTLQHNVLRLTNTSSATPNNITGTWTVTTGATLETRVAVGGVDSGTSSLGTAAIVLNGGTLKITPQLNTAVAGTPGFAARYFTGAPAGGDLNLVPISGTPFATQTTGVINAPTATPPVAGPGMTPLPAGLPATNFAAHYAGILNITTPGYYGFQTTSDDGSQIFLDGTLVANNNFAHGMAGQLPWGTVYLTAGPHVISERYYQGTGGGGVILNYQGPDTGGLPVLVGSIGGSVVTPTTPVSTAFNANAISVAGGSNSTIDIAVNTSIPTLTYTGTGASTLNVTGSGDISTLTVTGATTVVGDLTVNTPNAAHLHLAGAYNVSGAALLTKNGPGTLTVAGFSATAASNHSGATSINQGTLTITTTAPTFTGALQFGSAANTTTTGTLDLSTTSATFTGGMIVQTNSTAANSLIIGAGQTLTLNGNTVIGTTPTANSTTVLNATGGGSLSVINAAASGTFNVGGTSATSGAATVATADFSALGSLTISLNATNGTVVVNPNVSTGTTNINGRFSTLVLPSTGAGTTTITASSLGVGVGPTYNGAANQLNVLRLGSGVNTINVATINIGTGSRDHGSMTFNTASGTLKIRSAADPVNGRANFNMGTGTTNTGVGFHASVTNVFDVTGHSADILLGTVNIGAQHRNANRIDTFSFDTGTLDVTGIVMGINNGAANATAASSTWASTMNIGGGTFIVGTGGIDMGRGTVIAGGTDVINATLNITGGTTTLGNSGTLGAAVRMGTNSFANLTANGALNITGGAVTAQGHIIGGGGTSAFSSTLNLNGGSLNMSGNTIGGATAAASITNLVLASGTLSNVGQVNNGTAFAKTTNGTLTILGTNNWTGLLSVTAGTVLVNGSITAAGVTSTAAGATVGGNGTIAGPLTMTAGTLSPGTSVGAIASGDLTLATGSNFLVELNGTLPAQYDTVNVTGSVAISGANLLVNLGFTPSPTNEFIIINNDLADAVTGTLFTSVNGVALANNGNGTWTTVATDLQGVLYTVNYAGGDGNDVVLTGIPEPTTLSLMAMAGIGLLARRRRK